MDNIQTGAPATFKWLGGIDVIKIHHIHIIVSDVAAVQKAYEGVPGVDSTELHDVQKFNGELALMVRAKPVAIEYIQITNPEVGAARLIKDHPLGLDTIDFLVPNLDVALEQAKQAGFIIMGKMVIYGCWEVWLRHPQLNLNIEFMVMPSADFKPGPEDKKARVWIYGVDGKEDLFFE